MAARKVQAEYLQFQGQPFCEEDYCEAIHTVQVFMDSCDPAYLGYRWDDENLRIHLEPRGGRGYIELRAVRRVQKWAKRFLLKGWRKRLQKRDVPPCPGTENRAVYALAVFPAVQ